MKQPKKGELYSEYVTEYHIYRGQIKSLEKAKKICEALTILEEDMGIQTTRLYLKGCFFCPDIDLSKLGDTPMERNLRDIILQIEYSK